MKRIFLTFGDGGENFVAARERIAREAAATKQFDGIRACGWDDATEEAKQSPLRKFKKGAGYWVWKPDLIWAELSKLDDGDILVWCDAEDVLYPNARQWRRLFRLMESAEMIVPKIFACGMNWNRKEILERFSGVVPAGCQMCYQFEANAIIFRKTPRVVRLVSEWRDIALNHPECMPFVEGDRTGQLPGFIENRSDQSVLTLLIYKYVSQGLPVRRVWDFHFGWNVFGNPAILVVRQRGGGGYSWRWSARLRRAAERIVWACQDFLERHGLRICWIRV